MINKIVQNQLDKCEVADLSNFDSESNTYHIPKFKQIKLSVGECYIIKLKDNLLNGNSSEMLVSNWNKGLVPTCSYMKVEINKLLGKMVNVDGVCFDISTRTDSLEVNSWWFPLEDIEIIERV